MTPRRRLLGPSGFRAAVFDAVNAGGRLVRTNLKNANRSKWLRPRGEACPPLKPPGGATARTNPLTAGGGEMVRQRVCSLP